MIISMTAADLTKWIAYGPVVVLRMWGQNNNAGNVFIQFHQEPVISNGDVPTMKSFLAQGNNGFLYQFGEGIALSELSVGLSSTEPNYTAVGAGAGLDLTLEISTQAPVTSTMSVVGDLTTQQSTLQIWSEATGAATPKRLLRLDCVETANASPGQFIVITTEDAASDFGSMAFIAALPLNKTTTFFFGPNYTPRAFGKTGCKVLRDLVNNALSAGTDQMAIRAIIDNAQ